MKKCLIPIKFKTFLKNIMLNNELDSNLVHLLYIKKLVQILKSYQHQKPSLGYIKRC